MAQKFVSMLFSSRNQAHTFHLTTNSFAEHKALQAYYEGIVPLVDAWAEGYMGKYGRLTNVPVNSGGIKDPKKARPYFKNLLVRIHKLKLPRDTYLKNIQDEIETLIKTTIYMLSLK